jgi:hypothetical protein
MRHGLQFLHTVSSQDTHDYTSFFTGFIDAFRQSFDPLDKSVTIIQAPVIIFPVETGQSNAQCAAVYLKLAGEHIAEVAAAIATDENPIVIRSTRQCIRCLNQ